VGTDKRLMLLLVTAGGIPPQERMRRVDRVSDDVLNSFGDGFGSSAASTSRGDVTQYGQLSGDIYEFFYGHVGTRIK
jgi:hypothetical protein